MARIALTFNDDPQIVHQDHIELGAAKLLQVIEELSDEWGEAIRLTFFVSGQRLQQMTSHAPGLLKRMAQGGHEIANQSFSQPQNFHQLSIAQALQEVRRTHDLIEQIFGQPPSLFRPPHGLLSREVEAAIRAEFPDYQIVGWDRHDEKGGDTPSQFQERLLKHVHDRQVVLLHSWRQAAPLWRRFYASRSPDFGLVWARRSSHRFGSLAGWRANSHFALMCSSSSDLFDPYDRPII